MSGINSGKNGVQFEGRNDTICVCFGRGTKGKGKIQRKCQIFVLQPGVLAHFTDHISIKSTEYKDPLSELVVEELGENKGNHIQKKAVLSREDTTLSVCSVECVKSICIDGLELREKDQDWPNYLYYRTVCERGEGKEWGAREPFPLYLQGCKSMWLAM